MLLASPIVGTAFLLRDASSVWLVPLAGLLWAVLIDVAVVRWTERRLKGNEPELLARLAPLALH